MCKVTETKFNSLLEVSRIANDEIACNKLFAHWRWNGKPFCPHCNHSEKIYTFKDGVYYKCSECRKKFTVKVGTVFEGSNVKLGKWLLGIYLATSHKKGISSHQLSRDIEVTQKTAWFMLHRIRLIIRTKSFNQPLDGIIEVDESYIGGKEKNKHLSKRVKGTQGRSVSTKAPVLGMVKRGGDIIVQYVKDTKGKTIQPIIGKNVSAGSTIMSDEWWGYNGLSENYSHYIIKHGKGQYVDGIVHTNTIEGFWSLFKRGVHGIYHWTSKKHLQAYLNEFEFRYNTRNMNASSRMALAMTNSEGERLKYEELIKNN
ncbi:MAG: IS1595 family transposase [Bacteroidetes bacterium HGW-Bacteroidetes-2]|jgi:transposase-like protein|nr:MAG: IS1595 family transposase [Bacteroidetes bacterium HGW-Bacteroidetes-8]PKP26706.1 MAG: IS1595 family transposase [Bacteroidetes bacterium HGW-Bacteroidetes-2]